MTSKWETVRFGDVATRVIGRTPPRKDSRYWTADPGERPFCTIADMKFREVAFAREGISKLAEDEGKAKRVPAGSLLLSFKLSLGRVAITKSDLFTNEAIAWVIPGDRVTRDYLFVALESLDWGSLGSRAVKGKTLNAESLDAIMLPLPSLAEQRRIVDLIGAVDDAIEAAEVFLRHSRELRVAATRSYLDSDLFAPIGDIAEVSQGRGLPKETQGKVSGDYSWFKIADMTSSVNMFGYVEAETRMSSKQITELKGRLAIAGSVVFPRVGAAVLTEKKRILEKDAALDENHIILTPLPGVPPELLLAALEILKLGSLVQTGAVPSLNMKLVRETKIPWARQEHLAKIGDVCAETRSTLRTATDHADSLRKLRSELLTALLSGAHTIPESYDEVMPIAEETVSA